MSEIKKQLAVAEEKAMHLFKAIEQRGLIVAGKTELELNTEVFHLAEEI